MKHIKKISVLCLAFALICAVMCSASAKTYFISDGYKYFYADEGGIYIKAAVNGQTELDFPAKIDNQKVTGIAFGAFMNEQNITSVSFANADNLNTVGGCAFEGCTGLASVTLSQNITKIVYRAFYGCTALTEVDLSETQITEIQSETFKNCTALQKVTIPSTVTTIAANAFLGDDDLVIYCYTGSAAQTFAEENGIDYVLLDAEPTTEPDVTDPTTEPSTTVEPGDAGYALGDVDMDGSVNIRDATEIQKYIAEIVTLSSEQQTLADVDKNGSINITDVTTLQKYIARIIVSLE